MGLTCHKSQLRCETVLLKSQQLILRVSYIQPCRWTRRFPRVWKHPDKGWLLELNRWGGRRRSLEPKEYTVIEARAPCWEVWSWVDITVNEEGTAAHYQDPGSENRGSTVDDRSHEGSKPVVWSTWVWGGAGSAEWMWRNKWKVQSTHGAAAPMTNTHLSILFWAGWIYLQWFDNYHIYLEKFFCPWKCSSRRPLVSSWLLTL